MIEHPITVSVGASSPAAVDDRSRVDILGPEHPHARRADVDIETPCGLRSSCWCNARRTTSDEGATFPPAVRGGEREETAVASSEVWVASSRDELLAGAEQRVLVTPGDARSGSLFELVTIDGQRYFAKTLGYRTDWIMRVTGDRDLRTLKIWQAGIMNDAPAEIDHAVVGMAADGDNEDALLTILMRDVGNHLIPEGDSMISLETHLGFIDGLAALSARFWDWRDDLALTSIEERLRFFAPDNIAAEAAGDDPPGPIVVATQGWPRLSEQAPALAELLAAIHADPTPLADAMRGTPATFLQGDWKMGNLGMHPDGRTILIDWAYPGSGPVCWDLAWYLALNCRRLPMTKEVTIDALRAALERRGVSTDGWFELQLDLCLLGMTVCFGWEKAMGDAEELAWWERQAVAGAHHVRTHYPVPSL